MDLTKLVAMRDKLLAARYAGIKTVDYGDHRVEYRSDMEMATALNALNRDIAALQGGSVGGAGLGLGQRYPGFSKGL